MQTVPGYGPFHVAYGGYGSYGVEPPDSMEWRLRTLRSGGYGPYVVDPAEWTYAEKHTYFSTP